MDYEALELVEELDEAELDEPELAAAALFLEPARESVR